MNCPKGFKEEVFKLVKICSKSFLTFFVHSNNKFEVNVKKLMLSSYSAMLSIAKNVFHRIVAAADVTLRETLFFKQTIV
jgi:hypothetical protein